MDPLRVLRWWAGAACAALGFGAPAHEPRAAAVMPLVRFDAGLLSVHAHDAALQPLLADIAARAGFVVAPCDACAQTVRVRFDRLPLAQALARLLRDQNFALQWRGARPQRLWLLPQGAHPTASIARVPAAMHASTGTPDERALAVSALGRRNDRHAVGALARALADSDVDVRQAAVEALAEVGSADAVDALARALGDTDPHVREAAVTALGDIGGAAAITLLRRAQHDAVGFVRIAARETLDALQSRAR